MIAPSISDAAEQTDGVARQPLAQWAEEIAGAVGFQDRATHLRQVLCERRLHAGRRRLGEIRNDRKVVPPFGPVRSDAGQDRVVRAHVASPVLPFMRCAFREDLYYRLNGAVLRLPALRDRKDFDWIVERLLNADLGRSGQLIRISKAAHRALRAYPWPGNIRQLANALEFAKALCSAGVIEIADLPDYARQDSDSGASPGTSQTASPHPSFENDHSGDEAALEALLSEHKWNVSEVARRLGTARTTIYRRMNRTGLMPPNRRRSDALRSKRNARRRRGEINPRSA